MAEDAKKIRSSKARIVTRRVNELSNGIKCNSGKEDIIEKLRNLKYAIDELGHVQDEYVNLLTDENEVGDADEWYNNYDVRVNKSVLEGRRYIAMLEERDMANRPGRNVKLQKLVVPKFDSDPKVFYKWKETFERFTKDLNDETRYDYLFTSTQGEAHVVVATRNVYRDAMEKLTEKFGNVHMLLRLLIDDIRAVPWVKKGDFKAFEKFSNIVTEFRDRLILIGRFQDAENSYVLQELEGKLNNEDVQKWLESRGDNVSKRMVEDFVKWLDTQTELRRIMYFNSMRGNFSRSATSEYGRKISLHAATSSSVEGASAGACPVCQGTHSVVECPTFKANSIEERWNVAKSARLCFLCLQGQHRRVTCWSSGCQICSGPHHELLHKEYFHRNFTQHNTLMMPNNYNSSVGVVKPPGMARSLLPVVEVKIKGNGRETSAVAMLDSGSELNIITQACCNRLNLKGEPMELNIMGVGGVMSRIRTERVQMHVTDTFGVDTYIECIVLKNACGKLMPITPELAQICEREIGLRQSNLLLKSQCIDLLIGMTSPGLHQQYSLVPLRNGLFRMDTRFGACLVGTTSVNSSGNAICGTFNVSSMCILNDDIPEKKLWDHLQAELAGIRSQYEKRSTEEDVFEEKMQLAWNTDEQGRLEVKLPWKIDPGTLGNNRSQAVFRDLNLRNQLKKEPAIYNLFRQQIDEMIDGGILKKVNNNYPKRYLPLIAVTNLEKLSSKVRVCLDAKCKFEGKSLNDALLKGKVEMLDIFQALTRFRSGKYALVGDIKKMFWQIKLNESDQQYHGVIWDNTTYVFTRLCFGGKNSPPIADYSMKIVAAAGRDQHPKGSDMLKNKRHVDDLLDAGSSKDELTQKRDETQNLLKKFGFEVKKWISNDSQLGNVDNEKVLGLRWDVENDVLQPTYGKQAKKISFTKRNVLSKMAEIWDPLGVCTGMMVSGRLIFQSIVRLKLNWDETIACPELLERWRTWLSEVDRCEHLAIPRDISPISGYASSLQRCSLIGFADGSSVAYGCVLYLRWSDIHDSNIEVKFLASKGKVNPIKGITVPRSELCATLLLSRLTYSVLDALSKTEIHRKICDTVLFSDSTTALAWIKSDAIRYKPFVKNKVLEINELHPKEVWRYIPSSKNDAADLISKGCSHMELDGIIKGPDMLYSRRIDWPQMPKLKDDDEVKAEGDAKMMLVTTSVTEPLIDVERISSWRKLIGTTSYVLKLLDIFGKRLPDEKENMEKAKKYWVKQAQNDLSILSEKHVEKLMPFKDDDGIIRINGRFGKSVVFDEERKHPILLPKNHRISKLIIQQSHNDLYHPGHMRVIAEVRKTYWVIGINNMAKAIGRKCTTCRRWRGKSLEQVMANLPSFRITPGIPFENTAVDYFGPFNIKYGRRQRIKAYGAIFTCLTTRAIHVEMVTDLTSDRFLQGLRRFMSLYGKPHFIRSDNGRNFVGAAKELRYMLKKWKEDEPESRNLKEFCHKNEINWTWSTPLASHHNGAVESMIKSVKSSLNKVVKDTLLSEEEYRTVLAEVTACVNSRPLWPASDGDIEQPPITCADMLRPGGLPRDPESMNISCNPRKRYQHIQKVVNDWWKLWMLHFAPNLQIRSKWYKERKNIEKGDIVLIIDPHITRSRWKMAMVQEVFPDAVGNVRSALLKTDTGTYKRPITKLTLLLSKTEIEESGG